MIIWAGTSSKDVGMVVEHYPSVTIPQKQQEIQQVPGRNGDIVLSTGAYQNYTQSYQVFLDSKYLGGLETAIPRITDWLMGNEGYQRLEDSYFPGVYRMAYYAGGAEFVSVFNEYGEGTLTFNCAPEKYYKYGDEPITMTQGKTLVNPSAFKAMPKILFDLPTIGGSGTLSVNGETVTLNAGDVSEQGTVTIIIDTKLHKIYEQESGDSLSYRFSGDYEDLKLGKQSVVTWTGNLQNVRIIPRWWTI